MTCCGTIDGSINLIGSLIISLVNSNRALCWKSRCDTDGVGLAINNAAIIGFCLSSGDISIYLENIDDGLYEKIKCKEIPKAIYIPMVDNNKISELLINHFSQD